MAFFGDSQRIHHRFEFMPAQAKMRCPARESIARASNAFRRCTRQRNRGHGHRDAIVCPTIPQGRLNRRAVSGMVRKFISSGGAG